MSEANTRWGILYCPKGRNSKQREKIQKVLDERLVQYDFVQSESSDSVERLMTMLIRNGYKTIIIVGGDSALNDAVNCLMNEEKQVRDQIALGVIPNGIVNDFARYWDIKEGNLEQTIDSLKQHRVRTVDLGCIRYKNKKGRAVPPLFPQLCQHRTDSRRYEPAETGPLTIRVAHFVVHCIHHTYDIPQNGIQDASENQFRRSQP